METKSSTPNKNLQEEPDIHRGGLPNLPWGQTDGAVDKFYMKGVNENLSTLIAFTSIVPFGWFRNRFQCFLCDKVCMLISELRTHVKNQHSVLETFKAAHVSFSEVKFDITGLQCRICFEHFDEFDAVIEHINEKHAAGFNKEYRNYFMPFKIGEVSSPCLHCKKIFSNFQVLLKHVRKQHVEGKYLCRTCGLSYVYSYQLQSHVKACHFKEYKCNDCNKTFSYPGARQLHRAQEHGIAERQCRVCPKIFITHYQLRKHELEVHDIGLRISCKQCPAKFITQTHLKSHIQSTHSDKVNCTICDKSLSVRTLEQHMRNIHLCNETYACDVCHQEYTAPQSLKRHRKKHFSN